MARKPSKADTSTVTTRIGVLTGGEVVALISEGRDLFLSIDRVKIARRVNPKGTKYWVPVKQGWMVLDIDGPFGLEIKHNGRLVDWTPL